MAVKTATLPQKRELASLVASVRLLTGDGASAPRSEDGRSLALDCHQRIGALRDAGVPYASDAAELSTQLMAAVGLVVTGAS